MKVQNLLQTDDFVSRKLDVPIRDGLYLVYFFDPLLKQKTQNNQILFLLVISALTMILVFLLSLVYYRFLLGKRTINQIRSQEKLYSATFNNSAIGIAHIDLNGYILRANPVFCEFLHMAQPEADSINLFKLQNAEDNANYNNNLSL
ncbi:hypothetical protein THIOSC13_1560007 [uncultured Thiomicrorhabdus sp.]